MSGNAFHESWPQLFAILIPFLSRCGTAVLCGALIGLERELKGKPAGLRTNILIALGSAMYMSVGLLLSHEGGETGADPSRIAAQVVTGIGFIGAGCIIQDRRRVIGLTSAATIWVVAAIGIISGAGFPVLALVSSLIVVLTLTVLGWVETRFFDRQISDEALNDSRPGTADTLSRQ